MTMPTKAVRAVDDSDRAYTEDAANFWYRLSAPAPVAPSAPLAARELARRGRIASLVIAGELAALLLIAIDVPLARAVFPILSLALVCCVSALVLNRQGHTIAAGWLLALNIDGALVWALLSAHGGLDPLYVPVFYLMVTAALIAAALLPPTALFAITLFNCLFIFVDIRQQAHTMMWDQMITSSAILYSMILGPVVLHFIVALMAYVWSFSATRALRRADRAEEISRLERYQAEQTRRLEAGIQQILATHVRFANGEFNVRAPASQDNVLWQVSVALNNLLARYQRLAMEDGFTRLAQEQVGHVRMALRMWQSRQTPLWPQPVGSPIDSLVTDLKQLFAHIPSPRSPYALPAPQGRANTFLSWPDLGEPPRSRPTGQ